MRVKVLSEALPDRWLILLFVVCIFAMRYTCLSDMAWGQAHGSLQESDSGAISIEKTGTPSKANPKGGSDAEPTMEQALLIYSNAQSLQPRYLRTTLELASVFGIAEGWYYGTLEKPRWYWYDDIADSLRARFITGDAYCLDVNAWDTNMGHIFDGTGIYLLARSNDLSVEESILATVAASTAWEMFGEPREEFSINDAVMTPSSGLAIGEVMHQLGEFFQHSSATIPNRGLGYLFGPTAALHRWYDNNIPKPPASVDRFGFTTDAWHRFRLYAGGGGDYSHDTGKSTSKAVMGFDMEVVTAEKYGKPGEASIFYKSGTFNEMAFDVTLDGTGMPDLQFFAKTAFLGWYQQNISKPEATANLEGNSLFYGLSTAFEYYANKFAGYRRDDRESICDLVGPSLIADYYHRGLHVRTAIDVYPTFSMVQPAAGGLYDRTHSLQGVTGVYQEQGYYYALGLSAAGKTELDYGPFGLEALIRYHYFSSIQGIDRMQDRVTHDLDFEDQRLWLQLTLYWALPVEHLKLALDAGKIYRWSDIDTFSRNMDETRYYARLVYEF